MSQKALEMISTIKDQISDLLGLVEEGSIAAEAIGRAGQLLQKASSTLTFRKGCDINWDVLAVQPMTRPQGEVFYMDLVRRRGESSGNERVCYESQRVSEGTVPMPLGVPVEIQCKHCGEATIENVSPVYPDGQVREVITARDGGLDVQLFSRDKDVDLRDVVARRHGGMDLAEGKSRSAVAVVNGATGEVEATHILDTGEFEEDWLDDDEDDFAACAGSVEIVEDYGEAEAYTYSEAWSSEDRCYIARVEEFPSLTAFSREPCGVATNELKDIVYGTIMELREEGQPVPQPKGGRDAD